MNQYLILSLPSSGSDWLSRILAKNSELQYYDKEFFNPACNWNFELVDGGYSHILEKGFGCEWASSCKNIADRNVSLDLLESIYQETWLRQNYTFDKENYSAFRVPFFKRYFDIVYLYRSVRTLFPPSRARVLNWYDAIYASLKMNGIVDSPIDESIRNRVLTAHRICWRELESSGPYIPVIDYDILVEGSEIAVREELEKGWLLKAINIDGALQDVLDTRSRKEKKWHGQIENLRAVPVTS